MKQVDITLIVLCQNAVKLFDFSIAQEEEWFSRSTYYTYNSIIAIGTIMCYNKFQLHLT